MNEFLENIILELALFVFLGVLYYFYQKKKIIQYEENKIPMVMGFILEACLAERKDESSKELDAVIESLDDFLNNKTQHPPSALLKHFSKSEACAPDLKDVIREGLSEIEFHEEK